MKNCLRAFILFVSFFGGIVQPLADEIDSDEFARINHLKNYLEEVHSTTQEDRNFVVRKWVTDQRLLSKADERLNEGIVIALDNTTKATELSWQPVERENWKEFNLFIVTGEEDELRKYSEGFRRRSKHGQEFADQFDKKLETVDEPVCSAFVEWNDKDEIDFGALLIEKDAGMSGQKWVDFMYSCLVQKLPQLYGLPEKAVSNSTDRISINMMALWAYYRKELPIGSNWDDLQDHVRWLDKELMK